MKTTLKWISGILILMMSIKPFYSGGKSIFGGILFIVAGLLCLPPTLAFIENQINLRMKSYVKYLIVIGSLLIGARMVHFDKNKSSIQTEEIALAEPTLTISAIDLVKEYQNNEVRADEKFKGKNFYVEGIVGDIKKDILNNIYVTLKGNEMFSEVQCYFDDKAAASHLEKGMRITFLGKCDGLMMNVMMKNCKLVENLKDLKNSKN